MYESGAVRRGSAAGPCPVAVETFNALKQRQTSERRSPGETSMRGRVNLLNWDGVGAPAGLFPARPRRQRRDRRRDAPAQAGEQP